MARRCSFKLGIWSVGTFLTILLVNPYANLLSKNSRFTETASCGLVSEIYLFWGWTWCAMRHTTNTEHSHQFNSFSQSDCDATIQVAGVHARCWEGSASCQRGAANWADWSHWKTLDWWWLVWGIGKKIFPETWVISSQILRRAQSRAYGACCEIRWD